MSQRALRVSGFGFPLALGIYRLLLVTCCLEAGKCAVVAFGVFAGSLEPTLLSAASRFISGTQAATGRLELGLPAKNGYAFKEAEPGRFSEHRG
jgi:hypothetical protein